MSDAFELELCQGKYRYQYEAGRQVVWRNGERWDAMSEALTGNKFVFSMAVELDESKKEIERLREALAQQEASARIRGENCEALRAENEKLREALAERVASQTMLRDLSLGNGSINAAFEGGAAHLLAAAFADQFVESGATNYLEIHLRSDATGPLVVTLQRKDGKTPHQLRAEAEKERDELNAFIEGYREQSIEDSVLYAGKLREAEKERDALRAKIESMERQEPVGSIYIDGNGDREFDDWKIDLPVGSNLLYALPGAQPAPSVPDGWKLVPTNATLEMREAGLENWQYGDKSISSIWDDMLDAAPLPEGE